MSKLVRTALLCLAVLATALTASANYPPGCDCFSCAANPDQTCSTETPSEFTVWLCGHWLAQSDCGTTCETVTDCQSNADCFGGLCTRGGMCRCSGS